LSFGFCVVFLWFVFCFISASCLCFFCRHRDSNRTLYWSYLSSLLKSAIVMMDDVFALINRICQFATVLQAWWTTWPKKDCIASAPAVRTFGQDTKLSLSVKIFRLEWDESKIEKKCLVFTHVAFTGDGETFFGDLFRLL
jgi:hypothetical protein